MRRISVALLVAACFGVAAGWNAWSSDAGTGAARIRITDRQTSFVRVDVGKPGRSPGDMEISTQLLFNRRITPKPIGHAQFLCTYMTGIFRSCRGTIFLPRGKLVVGGSLRYRQFFELAVLGGTGLYDNARGTLTVTRVTRNSRAPRRELLLFRLVG